MEGENLVTEIISRIPLDYFYLAIFISLFLTGLGAPWPEDVILITSGFLVDLGFGSFLGATIASFAGIIVSDTMVYALGYVGGREILTRKPFNKIIKAILVEKIEKLFRRWGKIIVFFGRFGAGLRSPIFFTCGVSKFPYPLFLLFDGLAALLSVPLFIYLGGLFSDYIYSFLDQLLSFKKKLILVIIILALSFFIIKKHIMKIIYRILKIGES